MLWFPHSVKELVWIVPRCTLAWNFMSARERKQLIAEAAVYNTSDGWKNSIYKLTYQRQATSRLSINIYLYFCLLHSISFYFVCIQSKHIYSVYLLQSGQLWLPFFKTWCQVLVHNFTPEDFQKCQSLAQFWPSFAPAAYAQPPLTSVCNVHAHLKTSGDRTIYKALLIFFKFLAWAIASLTAVIVLQLLQ